ncbi:MMPL family transporter [Actinoplanes sp. NPDC051861]|uniref:MMPL family transporter n=1 Tax=Actinoplanes sp. NPDC051861 TaxID=3155170 RepID=UPI00341C0E91
MFRLIARFAIRRPWVVITAWLVVACLGAGLGVLLFDRLTPSVRAVQGSESQRGGDLIREIAPQPETITAVISGTDVRAAATRAAVTAAVTDIRAVEGVARAADPYAAPGQVAQDGQAVLVAVTFESGLDVKVMSDAIHESAERLRAVEAPEVSVSGGRLLNLELNRQASQDVQRAELISLPVILVLLVVIFGGLLAGSLPLIVAIVGAAATLLVLYLFSLTTEISVYAVQVPTMLGLGLAVDYGLLIVTRFREERLRLPDDLDEAILRTIEGAGRTVFFSGLTVAVSLAGILVFPSPFLRSLGLAAAVVVLVDMAASLTLIPALLSRWGRRIKIPQPSPKHGALFARLGRAACRAPIATLLALSAGLLLVAVPALNLRLTGGDARSLPPATESRQFYDAVAAHFPIGSGSDPVTVILPAGTDPGLAGRLAALPGVRAAAEPRPGTDGSTILRLTPAGTTDGPEALQLVRDLREARGDAPVLVSGAAASLLDYQDMMKRYTPIALGGVLVTILLLLFAFSGSILIPIRTVLTTLLSLGAALGGVVWILQEGHFAGLIGAEEQGALNVIVPPLIIGLAFGLAMDYEIFILARMRDIWVETGDHRRAIVDGLRLTGRVVTSAALLIIVVFAAFMTGGFAPVQQIGLGLAIAVLVDATVVRMLLVPASMAVLGRWAWWAPPPLRRLHDRFGLRESTETAGAVSAGPKREIGEGSQNGRSERPADGHGDGPGAGPGDGPGNGQGAGPVAGEGRPQTSWRS